MLQAAFGGIKAGLPEFPSFETRSCTIKSIRTIAAIMFDEH